MFLLKASLVLICCLSTKAAPMSSNFSMPGNFSLDDLMEWSRAATTKLNTCECAKPVAASGRIVGGQEVNPKYRLPYQVYFQAPQWSCGATIINKRYVITAAHCLVHQGVSLDPSTQNLRVVVGEHNTCDGLTNEGGQDLKVEKVHVRSDYNNPARANDFAIMKVAQDIKFTDKVKPACLPETTTKDYAGQMATISGWGGTVGYPPGGSAVQPRQCGNDFRILENLFLDFLQIHFLFEEVFSLDFPLCLKSLDDVLVLPSNFMAESANTAESSTMLQSQYLEGTWDDHPLLFIIRRGSSLEGLQTSKGGATSLCLVGDHSADSTVKNLGRSTVMEGTAGGLDIHLFL